MPLKPEASERLESMKKPTARMLAILGLLALASVFIWMNRYQYEHTGTTQVLVRINRFTGQQCFLTSDRGWDSQLMRAVKEDKQTDNSIFQAMTTDENQCRMNSK